MFGSLHRDALREVSRAIHVAAPSDGDVIGQQLQRDYSQDRNHGRSKPTCWTVLAMGVELRWCVKNAQPP
jgi:hypothetical protein